MNTRYALLIAYDGSLFSGWQIQPYAPSIQEIIENTLSKILSAPIKIQSAGRTDSGVHAMGQVAHFTHDIPLKEQNVTYALNALLPPSIVIRDAKEVAPSFHACYSALGKRYSYILSLKKNPFIRRFCPLYPYPLSYDLLKRGVTHMVGTHDFSSFAHKSHPKTNKRGAIRTITKCSFEKERDHLKFVIEGDGFLHKMVRNIVGTLLEVGRGKRSIDSIPSLFEAKNRSHAGETAAAEGLILEKVFYEKNPFE